MNFNGANEGTIPPMNEIVETVKIEKRYHNLFMYDVLLTGQISETVIRRKERQRDWFADRERERERERDLDRERERGR